MFDDDDAQIVVAHRTDDDMFQFLNDQDMPHHQALLERNSWWIFGPDFHLFTHFSHFSHGTSAHVLILEF